MHPNSISLPSLIPPSLHLLPFEKDLFPYFLLPFILLFILTLGSPCKRISVNFRPVCLIYFI